MRKLLALALAVKFTSAAADADPRYADPAFILAELEELATTCAAMADQDVREEIFGLEIRRNGDRCLLGRGEVDENLVRFFHDNDIKWAGMDGHDGIWVRVAD